MAALFAVLTLAAGTGEAAAPAIRGPLPPPGPPPFYWVTSTLSPDREATLAPQPPLPDLSVQWIERRPRYHRYCVSYDRGLPELCPGTANDKRFPTAGEVVTLTAHIANQGTVDSPAVSARWRLDGAPFASAILPPLAPGVTTTLTVTWPWQTDPHTITLLLDPDATLSETSRANNEAQHRTDALYLDIAVHPLVAAAFQSRPNMAGSWSFADWMQAQVAALNEDLAASTYPSAPRGALDRVRVDHIVATDLLGGGEVTSTLDFDGRWTFRVEPDDPDTAEDESAMSAEAYAAAYATRIDWGLVHELAHQLGVIDLYQLNVAGSYQNQVAEDGFPLLTGYQWPNPGLMGGGDRGDHPWYRFSEHTVLALNKNYALRRGYFGEYLFDLPGQARVQVLDNRGQPLADAQVDVYQTDQGVLGDAALFSGLTDQDGWLTLANRPVPFGGVTTATGHQLRPNPFGAIDVVGQNGQMLLAASKDGQSTYAWWPITEFNLARWQGNTQIDTLIATHVAPPGAPQPPEALDGRLEGTSVTLAWPASPDPDVVGYRVYRGVEPAYYPLQPVTTTAATTFTDTRLQSARYAVAALDDAGRESGLSPILRAPRLVLPVAVAVDAGDNRVALDRHDGALVGQLGDDRWVGRLGSIHLGLTGSEAIAPNSQGDLLIANASEDRVTVLDGDLARINWFGRERFVTGTLGGPAAVVQTGPGFTVQLPAAADSRTLGLARFDDDIALSASQPLTASGVTVVPGRFGSAVRINGQDQLVYDATGHIDAEIGSVQLWVRPEWVWDDDREHVFLEIGTPEAGSTPDGYFLRLAKADWNGLYAWVGDGTREVGLYGDIGNWAPGFWRHLAVAWQAVQPGTDYRRYTLWVDGVLQDSQVLRRPAAGLPGRIAVGSGLDGSAQADAAIDDLHISAAARVGNSQATRLIVSQRDLDRIDVLDWLGNPLSSYGSTGSGPGEFRSPQGLAIRGDAVWVADRGNGRIQVLHFDGSTLTSLGTLAAGLVEPHSLAATPEGWLLASDTGDNRVKLLDPDGVVRRSWRGPTDGQPGQFSFPAGIALTPAGDAVVADRDNGRVVRIVQPTAPLRTFLPSISRSP
ncbi:MAG: CARDB domain-containing protein [Caldilineales bacterium]